MAREAEAVARDATTRGRRFRTLATPESRGLELALAAVETLRVRGVLTGTDLCRLACFLGYDEESIARAWKTRAEFDPDTVPYELDVPLARVISLD